MFTWLFSVSCFLALGSYALTASLGYQWSESDKRYVRMGLIELNGVQPEPNVNVILDGKTVGSKLPLRITDLKPGYYTVRVEAPDRNSWEASVKLEANERKRYGGIVLALDEAQPVLETALTAAQLKNAQMAADRGGIDVRSLNELWVDDQFILRTAGDIVDARRLRVRNTVVIETAGELFLVNTAERTTQALAKIPTDATAYMLSDNARVLTYSLPADSANLPVAPSPSPSSSPVAPVVAAGELVYRVELFASVSPLTRFLPNVSSVSPTP